MFNSEHRQESAPGRKGAAALAYNPAEEGAPRVVAKGMGHLAEKILLEAKKHGIPILEDKLLFGMLYALELGAEIPLEIYEPVARILAFVYSVYSRTQKREKIVHNQSPVRKETVA